MAKKDEILFHLADGTPVYASDAASTPGAAPRRFGDNTPQKSAPSQPEPNRPALMPFASKPQASPQTPEARSDGKPEMLVDYTKTPGKTTVPGQPGYDAKKDPFRERTAEEKAADAKKAAADKKQADLLERHPLGEWWQQKRGEKTNGSGLNAVHLDKWEADKLKNELEQQRASQEFFYPGAKGRSHSSGGTNLGEPEWGGSGGGAFFNGTNEWEMASGAVVGQNGIELVSVLDSWNIYNGQ